MAIDEDSEPMTDVWRMMEALPCCRKAVADKGMIGMLCPGCGAVVMAGTFEQIGASVLGHFGGRKGGPARAAALSPQRRSAIARHAANVRWGTAR